MKIMESLKKGGFGGAKMFTKEDLENLSADEMAEKVCRNRRSLWRTLCQRTLHKILEFNLSSDMLLLCGADHVFVEVESVIERH